MIEFCFADSVKYYRDLNGFVYKKSGENQKTVYLDCLRQPNCVAGARYYKDSRELVIFSTHSDEKPDEHLVFKIAFEENLKKEVCKSENAKVSVLNLYKHALGTQFKGIWLPTNHRSLFLVKLRRTRRYEKEKPKVASRKTVINRASVLMADVATSPTMPQSLILQRIVYSADKSLQGSSLNSSNNTMVVPNQTSPIASTSVAVRTCKGF